MDTLTIERNCGGGDDMQMIKQLYFERLPDGGYEVVCNDLTTTSIPPKDMFPEWVERLIDVGSCIEILIQPIIENLEYEDDLFGVRVGYMPREMYGLAYGGQVWCIPDFMLEGAVARLMCEDAARDSRGVGR